MKIVKTKMGLCLMLGLVQGVWAEEKAEVVPSVEQQATVSELVPAPQAAVKEPQESVQPIVVPVKVPEAKSVVSSSNDDKQSAFHGFDSLYMIQGSWSITSLGTKVDELDIESDTKDSKSAFGLNYLKHAGTDIWMGPYLAYGFEKRDTDGSEISLREWRPGLEIRKVITTKGNGYVSVYGRAGWIFAYEAYDIADGTIEANYSGFTYGGGLSIGNRLGDDDAYILESNIEFNAGSLSGEIGQGSNKFDLKVDASRFAFGISIGKLF